MKLAAFENVVDMANNMQAEDELLSSEVAFQQAVEILVQTRGRG